MNSKRQISQIKLSKATKRWALLFPVWLVLIRFFSLFPDFIEKFYSNGLYKYIRNLSFWFTNWTSISLGDIFYIGFFSVLIFKLFRLSKKTRKLRFYLVYLLSVTSKIYLLFHLLWGMNYYRIDLNEKLNLEKKYTQEELFDFLDETLAYSNQLHYELTQNDSIPVQFNYENQKLKKDLNKKIALAAADYYFIEAIQPQIKKSLFSTPLTYSGFAGYINPFTNESQYNTHIIDFKKPVTIVHEIAHQMGYAKENEANFIAYWVLLKQGNKFHQYSASTSILKHLLREVYGIDQNIFVEYKACINFGIRENYRESQEFWESYANPIEPIMKQFYTSYLNINNQPKGMESYSYVTDLLINYNKNGQVYSFEKN